MGQLVEHSDRELRFNVRAIMSPSIFEFDNVSARPVYIPRSDSAKPLICYIVKWDQVPLTLSVRISRYLEPEDIFNCAMVSKKNAIQFSQNAIWNRYVTQRMHYLIQEEGDCKKLVTSSSHHWSERFLVRQISPTTEHYDIHKMTFIYPSPSKINPNTVYFNALKERFLAFESEERKALVGECKANVNLNISPKVLMRFADRKNLFGEMMSKSILFVLLDRHYNDGFFTKSLALKGVWKDINMIKCVFHLDRFLRHDIRASFKSRHIVKRMQIIIAHYNMHIIHHPDVSVKSFLEAVFYKEIEIY